VKKPSSAIRQVGPYLNLGGVMAACVALGALFGHWLDGKYGWTPWGLLSGSLFGIGSAFYHFFKVVLGQQKKIKPENSQDEEQKP
jgi:F0F1-type ATP synthase assembly protein I